MGSSSSSGFSRGRIPGRRVGIRKGNHLVLAHHDIFIVAVDNGGGILNDLVNFEIIVIAWSHKNLIWGILQALIRQHHPFLHALEHQVLEKLIYFLRIGLKGFEIPRVSGVPSNSPLTQPFF